MDFSVSGKNIPGILKNIIADINTPGHRSKSNIDSYIGRWNLFAGQVKKEVPEVIAADENRTLLYGELSPGCVLCKKGKWDCVFITMNCNLDCSFCYSPRKVSRQKASSAFGDNIKSVAESYRRLGIKGIGFTGGEPLMEYGSLISWFKRLKRQLPDNYFWVYTNGLLLSKKYVDVFSENKLDEIRFNLAATGYCDRDVLSMAEYASKKIQGITVEIPAIPKDKDILLSSLASWVSAGVKYLNLHELISEPGTNSEMYNEQCGMLTLNDGHRTGIQEQSKFLILDVIKFVKKNKLSLNINICSLSNKLKQVRDRRNNFGRLLKNDYEKITDGEFLETILVYRDSKDFRFINPEFYDENSYKSYNAVRLLRHAPLSVYDSNERYFKVCKIK